MSAHGGTATPTTGGMVTSFASPSAALACAGQIQTTLAGGGGGPPPRSVKVGLSIGEVEADGAVLRGRAVEEALRLCSLAQAGQILATRTVRLVAGPDRSIDHVGAAQPVDLGGPGGPVDVDVINWGAPTTRPVRVVLADDAVLIREGLARLLSDEGLVVVGQTDDASQLLALVGAEEPDVVITDVRMPPSFTLEGIEAALQLRRRSPQVGVLVLSQYMETRYAVDLLGKGARGVGYLLKERVTAVVDFVAAVQRVAGGGTAIDPEMVAALIERSRRTGGLDLLSSRQTEVLSCMAEGLSNTGIARRLVLGGRTVESHVGAIFTKLGLLGDPEDDRRVLAVIQYLRGQ